MSHSTCWVTHRRLQGCFNIHLLERVRVCVVDRGEPMGISSLFLPHGSQGSNSGHQAWCPCLRSQTRVLKLTRNQNRKKASLTNFISLHPRLHFHFCTHLSRMFSKSHLLLPQTQIPTTYFKHPLLSKASLVAATNTDVTPPWNPWCWCNVCLVLRDTISLQSTLSINHDNAI